MALLPCTQNASKKEREYKFSRFAHRRQCRFFCYTHHTHFMTHVLPFPVKITRPAPNLYPLSQSHNLLNHTIGRLESHTSLQNPKQLNESKTPIELWDGLLYTRVQICICLCSRPARQNHFLWRTRNTMHSVPPAQAAMKQATSR